MKALLLKVFRQFVAALVLVLVGLSASAETDSAETNRAVSLVKGGSTRLPIEQGIKRVVVGNDKVIDARPDKEANTVLVTGVAEGSSELRIERLVGAEWVFRITVRADLQGVLDEVKLLLADVEGLELKLLGDKILIKGVVLTLADDERVRTITEAYAGTILNLAKFDLRRVYKFLEEEIRKDLRANSIDTVTAKIASDRVILEGTVISQEEMDRVIKLAQLRLPNVVNLLRVEDAMIETDIRFVQITSDSGASFGHNVLETLEVGAQGALSGAGTGKSSLSYGVSASAGAKINALIGSGSASNLVQTHISTKSGEEGRFHSGGEDNIIVAGNLGGDLKTVEYGIIVRVRPVLKTREIIENKVYVEVSVPIQKTREGLVLDKFNSEGTIICRKGEGIILSGLFQSLASRTGSRTPLLGYIPLVDMFFSKRDRKGSNKELVAVITPQPTLPRPGPSEPFSASGARLNESISVK
jgi:pilus assembly protein CpaC